ncbi:alpha/beta hydrolase-fold protein [Sorangium cellulosum]|uniref:alpha/beta hydrolase-fold protein n=1 Tax=Sorangium cellulosum TaxID=56 RepID=UPI0003FFA475|nr:alpha/beta hydrolase-fold protein [Sorangium cellulosum]
MSSTAPVSRYLQQFQQAAARDSRAAVAELESLLRSAGGPLVEPIDDRMVLVTFVWIGPAQRVSVRGAQIFPDVMRPSHPMRRVEGTDVWYLSAAAPANVLTVYQYLLDEPETSASLLGDPAGLLRAQLGCAQVDPVNPRRIYPQAGVIAGDFWLPERRWESILDLGGAEQPGWFEHSGAPAGAMVEHRLASAALSNERTVTVYTPPGFTATRASYPLVVMLDGECWLRVARLHVGLDNLIAARAIVPPVVAFVHNAPSAEIVRSRIAETACNPAFAAMLAEELLPMLRERYNVSADPDRVILAGNSYTGLAAAHAALERPAAFGAVMSTSGTHGWGYANHPAAQLVLGKDDEPEWLTRQYAMAPRKAIRFWIDVGQLETGTFIDWMPGVDQRAANRHLRTVLQAKGYQVTYYESPGGHEFATFRHSVARGLQAMLGTG